jgi:hypothetical protein
VCQNDDYQIASAKHRLPAISEFIQFLCQRWRHSKEFRCTPAALSNGRERGQAAMGRMAMG